MDSVTKDTKNNPKDDKCHYTFCLSSCKLGCEVITVIKKIMVVLMVLLITLILGLSTYNHISKQKDLNALEDKGTRIYTESGEYHIHRYGEGDVIVFLSGLGTTSPLYDFKPLWVSLKNDYEIVVIERQGYGYNDSSSHDKAIDTTISGYRNVLKQIGIDGPISLIAHSMAGLEAVYWAQHYPKEIHQIVALDPTIAPMVIDHLALPGVIQRNIQYMVGLLGIARFMDEDALREALPILNYEAFTSDEQANVETLFYANMFNRNIIREMKHIKDNAFIISGHDKPLTTDMLVFLSEENIDNHTEAEDVYQAYFETFEHAEIHILPTYHYVHHECHETILETFDTFISDD